MIKGIWQSIVGQKPDYETKVFEEYSETDLPGTTSTFAVKSQVKLAAYKQNKGLFALNRQEKSSDLYKIKVCRAVSNVVTDLPQENLEAQMRTPERETKMPFGFEEDRTYTKAEMQNIFNQWELVIHDKALDMKIPKALQTHFNLGNPERNAPKSKDSPFRNRTIKSRVSTHKFV